MNRTKKYLGLVLRKKILKEKDILVYFFTRQKGKIPVLAKGASKITSRRLSHIDTGNLLFIQVSENRNFMYLKDTQLISGFSVLKNNLEKAERFFLVLKLLDKNLADFQKEQDIFDLCLRVLKQLAENESVDLKKFERKLLEILGLA